jgi:hypothetical protein
MGISSGLHPEFAYYFAPDLTDDAPTLTVGALHPLALIAKAAKSDTKNHTWTQAMLSPDTNK